MLSKCMYCTMSMVKVETLCLRDKWIGMLPIMTVHAICVCLVLSVEWGLNVFYRPKLLTITFLPGIIYIYIVNRPTQTTIALERIRLNQRCINALPGNANVTQMNFPP